MGEYYRDEPLRTVPFHPKDHPVSLDTVDWKTRYNELKNKKDWDPETQFVGLKRLGDRYHPLDPFFKFDGVPPENATFDRIWWPMFGGIAGTIAGVGANWWTRRPFFSAILPSLAAGAFGMGCGLFAWNNSRRRARERDAVLVHYMILHEQELPLIERKRFGQLTKPWYPMRLGTDGFMVEK